MGNAGSSSPSSPDFHCYGDDCPPCGIFEVRTTRRAILRSKSLPRNFSAT